LPRALIVGCKGQDGTLLAEFLRRRAYTVDGVVRHGEPPDSADGFHSPQRCHSIDIEDTEAVARLLEELLPDEIYFLAAYHHSAEGARVSDHELVSRSFAINTLALNNFLSCICTSAPATRLFYAASSRVFGEADVAPQDEATPMKPVCPYGISKAAGASLCRYYRRERNLFASVGILYNHESPLRSAAFLSRKIVRAVTDIKRGLRDRLVVGSLNAKVDWGFAADYVEAMWRILQAERPDDFIVSTGIAHSVLDFVKTAFRIVELPWERYIEEDAATLDSNRPSALLQGYSAKLERVTGWHPQVSFEEMIATMIRAEMIRAESCN